MTKRTMKCKSTIATKSPTPGNNPNATTNGRRSDRRRLPVVSATTPATDYVTPAVNQQQVGTGESPFLSGEMVCQHHHYHQSPSTGSLQQQQQQQQQPDASENSSLVSFQLDNPTPPFQQQLQHQHQQQELEKIKRQRQTSNLPGSFIINTIHHQLYKNQSDPVSFHNQHHHSIDSTNVATPTSSSPPPPPPPPGQQQLGTAAAKMWNQRPLTKGAISGHLTGNPVPAQQPPQLPLGFHPVDAAQTNTQHSTAATNCCVNQTGVMNHFNWLMEQPHHPICEKNPYSNFNRYWIMSMIQDSVHSQQQPQQSSHLPSGRIAGFPPMFSGSGATIINYPTQPQQANNSILFDYFNPSFLQQQQQQQAHSQQYFQTVISAPMMSENSMPMSVPQPPPPPPPLAMKSAAFHPQRQQMFWNQYGGGGGGQQQPAPAPAQSSFARIAAPVKQDPLVTASTDFGVGQRRQNYLNPNASDFIPSQQNQPSGEPQWREPFRLFGCGTSQSPEFSCGIKSDFCMPIEVGRRQHPSVAVDNHLEDLAVNMALGVMDEEPDHEAKNPDVKDYNGPWTDEEWEDVFELQPSNTASVATTGLGDGDYGEPIITLSEEKKPCRAKVDRRGSMSNVSLSGAKTIGELSQRPRSLTMVSDAEPTPVSFPVGPARNRAHTSASTISEASQKRLIKADRYKTELCFYMEETGKCPYGAQCNFAHGVDDLRPRQPHDRNERSVACNDFLNSVCYRGSSRCWYLHPEPVFNFKRLRADLAHWIGQPFRANHLTIEWFDPDYDPKLFGQEGNRQSRLAIWHQENENGELPEEANQWPDVRFGDQELDEYFDTWVRYRSLFLKLASALGQPASTTSIKCCLDSYRKPSSSGSPESQTPKYQYNWFGVGIQVPDQQVWQAFNSVVATDCGNSEAGHHHYRMNYHEDDDDDDGGIFGELALGICEKEFLSDPPF